VLCVGWAYMAQALVCLGEVEAAVRMSEDAIRRASSRVSFAVARSFRPELGRSHRSLAKYHLCSPGMRDRCRSLRAYGLYGSVSTEEDRTSWEITRAPTQRKL
jgi:hypothetical protein